MTSDVKRNMAKRQQLPPNPIVAIPGTTLFGPEPHYVSIFDDDDKFQNSFTKHSFSSVDLDRLSTTLSLPIHNFH